MKTIGFNLFFRGLTIGSKLLLMVFIVKFLSLAEMGVYGLFTVTITLAIYLLGLDFYTYGMRNILKVEEGEQKLLIRNQFVFYLVAYVALMPMLLSIFFLGAIEWQYLGYFYIILALEHFSQELYRLLVTFSKPVQANIALFFRSGIWIYVLLACWFLGYEQLMNIQSVLLFWMVGASVAGIYAGYLLRDKLFFSHWFKAIDWAYIKTGIIVAMPFFASTIAYKIIEFADRYMIDFWMTKDDVGVYTTFAGLGNLVEVFVQTTVIVIFSPKLISAFNKDKEQYHTVFAQFKKQNVLYTLLALVLACAVIFPLLAYMQKDELDENILVFFILALSKVAFNFSLIYHYALYVRHQDKSIMYTTIVGACLNVGLNFILIPKFGLIGAAIATLVSFLLIFVLKWRASSKYIQAGL